MDYQLQFNHFGEPTLLSLSGGFMREHTFHVPELAVDHLTDTARVTMTGAGLRRLLQLIEERKPEPSEDGLLGLRLPVELDIEVLPIVLSLDLARSLALYIYGTHDNELCSVDEDAPFVDQLAYSLAVTIGIPLLDDGRALDRKKIGTGR